MAPNEISIYIHIKLSFKISIFLLKGYTCLLNSLMSAFLNLLYKLIEIKFKKKKFRKCKHFKI